MSLTFRGLFICLDHRKSEFQWRPQRDSHLWCGEWFDWIEQGSRLSHFSRWSALISGGDISSKGNIVTSNLSGNGGKCNTHCWSYISENLAAPAYNVTSVSITGISATGGNVNLSDMDEFTTRGVNGSAGNGGAVSLIAYRGTAGSGGQVVTPNGIAPHINTFGNGSGSNGDVLIAAGANIPNAIQINSEVNTGYNGGYTGTAGSGSITLSAVQPQTGYVLSTSGDFKVNPNSVLGTTAESGGILLKSILKTYNAGVYLTAGGVVSNDSSGTNFIASDIRITAAAIGTGTTRAGPSGVQVRMSLRRLRCTREAETPFLLEWAATADTCRRL